MTICFTCHFINHVNYIMRRSVHSLVRPAHSQQLSFLLRCTSIVPIMETSSGNCWHFEILFTWGAGLQNAERECKVLDFQNYLLLRDDAHYWYSFLYWWRMCHNWTPLPHCILLENYACTRYRLFIRCKCALTLILLYTMPSEGWGGL